MPSHGRSRRLFVLGPAQDAANKDHRVVCPICSTESGEPVTLVERMMPWHFSRIDSHRERWAEFFYGSPVARLSCPYHTDCGKTEFVRAAEVSDHLNEVHDIYPEEWSTNENKMKRKRIEHLIASFVAEAYELNQLKRRIYLAERHIRQFDPYFFPYHGLDGAILTQHEENESLVTDKPTKGAQRLDVAKRLVAMRNEARVKGRDISGNEASWNEIAQEIEKLAGEYFHFDGGMVG